MKNPDERDLEIAALKDRLFRLSEASLRVNESLDLDKVLQEVVGNACALTDARYGGITILDPSGQQRDYVTHGLTEQERTGGGLAPGMELFEHFSRAQEPLKLADMAGYLESLGLTDILPQCKTFLATAIRHGGAQVGNFYLADKGADREFTQEDEETLAIFTSQAALAIAYARRYQEERRARADLEALINTAPVGVVVIDARTARIVSSNREADRICGELCLPGMGGDLESVMGALTIQRADGRAIRLEDFSSSDGLSAIKAVRAEEIVVKGPDGEHSITILANVTPILSSKGEIESVVVTIQDMTPLEEVERLRAEFLGMVSHELRTPLTSIRGSATTLLNEESALDPAEMRQFHRIIVEQADRMRGLISDLLDVARIETGTLSVSPALSEVATLVDEAKSTFLSSGGRNNVRIKLPPSLPLVIADRRRIVQVIGNLVSNASRHSPESSVIRIIAAREGLHVAISVVDEGRGIPADRLPHLFRKFSRIEVEDQGGETGLGLAICKGIVEAHEGRIWAESDGPGLGARFTFTLPAGKEVATAAPEADPNLSVGPPRAGLDRPRILVVDDDPQTLRYVRDILSKAGCAPTVTVDPKEVSGLVEGVRPHLVLLDLMLPGTDGIELMKAVHEMARVPVIFLSAYGQDQVIAKAFKMGAADYVVKPFSPTELAARIEAALRRQVAPFGNQDTGTYILGDLVIDYEQRRVTVAGLRVELTAIEYRLLVELSTNAGRLMTHEQLLRRVWGQDKSGGSGPVRTIVRRLRRKLGDDADNPTYIFTKRRVGYWMETGETDGQKGRDARPALATRGWPSTNAGRVRPQPAERVGLA